MKVAGHGAGRVPTARRRVAPPDPSPVIYANVRFGSGAIEHAQPLQDAVGERRYDDDSRRSVTRLHQVKAMAANIHQPSGRGETPTVARFGNLLVSEARDPGRGGN